MQIVAVESLTVVHIGWQNSPETAFSKTVPLNAELDPVPLGQRRLVVARHLALACIELAEVGQGTSRRVEEYRQAEARHRALTDLEGLREDSQVLAALPKVKASQRREISLVDLLGLSWGWENLPDRQVDRDLIEAAKELLEGLAWRIPAH
ncbi:hypothetical protein BH23PLA1_BH23PLA1_02860 [soil metagenome]